MIITEDNAFYHVLLELKQLSEGKEPLLTGDITEEELTLLDEAMQDAIHLCCAEVVELDFNPEQHVMPGLILVEPRITEKGLAQLGLMELLQQGAN
jgi:hypothetical protein